MIKLKVKLLKKIKKWLEMWENKWVNLSDIVIMQFERFNEI